MEDILESPLDFKTKSREIWGEIRSGTPFEQIQKDIGNYTGNFYGSGNSEGINFPKLIRFIKDSERDPTLIFNWDDYDIPATVQQYRVRDGEGGFVDRFKIIKNNIPFVYENEKKEKIKTAVSGILNKRVDYLEDEWGYRSKIDAKKLEIYASLRYYYKNTKNFRIDASNTPNPNDYKIEDKYVAISLTSENLEDFCHFVREIEGEAIFKKLQSDISEAYLKQIFEITIPKELDFLYENAPDFVFQNILDELLFEDLRALLKWDQKKWFTDSSNAMMKILLGFKNHKKLYEMLEQDPSFVLQLYREMDKSNPEMFGEMMSFLGILFCNKERDKRTIEIPIGKNYSLDSDLFFDKNKKTLNISVFEKTRTVNNNNAMSNYVGGLAPAIPTGTIAELKSIGTYPELHPLDMITIITEDGTSQTVAAIYVKYLSDVAEKKQIQNTVIVIVTVVSILVSAGALASGAGAFWSTMAVADIALGTVDLALRVDEIKKELSKYEAGKWFVDNWDAIYGVAGMTMLSATLVRGILINGPILLSKLTYQKGVLKNFVQSAIASAILNIEIANFTKNTLRFLKDNTEIVLATSGSLNEYKLLKLNEKGIFIVTGTTQKGEEYAMLHYGRCVAKGGKKSFYEQIKHVARNYYKEDKLVDVLEEMEDDVWKYFDKELASGTRYETKGLENIYTVGSKIDFERGVKYLNEKEREAYEIFVQHDKIVDIKGKLVDTNGSVSVNLIGQAEKVDYAIFVMGEDGTLYLSKYSEVGKFHHSSFLGGKPISAAGEIIIEKGIIKEVNNASGHYKPAIKLVEKNILKELQNRGYFTIENYKEIIKFKSEF